MTAFSTGLMAPVLAMYGRISEALGSLGIHLPAELYVHNAPCPALFAFATEHHCSFPYEILVSFGL